MRLDFDIKIEQLNKTKLKVIGDQFVLNAQVELMLNQNEKLHDTKTGQERDNRKTIYELERELKDMSKARYDVEQELNQMNVDNREEQGNNYDQKMY